MKTDEDSLSAKKVPQWATQPFENLLASLEQLQQLLELSIKGISILQSMPGLIEAVGKAKGDVGEDHLKLVARAKQEAELARREVTENFPLLHAQWAVTIWSTLESTMRLFTVRWLQNYENALQIDAIQKLKVKVGEYDSLQGDEKYFFLANKLEQETTAPLKVGVNKFEVVLAHLGLSGKVHPKDRALLHQLNNARNLLVHRSGIVDKKFAEACPAFGLRPGDALKITYAMLDDYFNAVTRYGSEMIFRLATRYGTDMGELTAPSAQPDEIE